MATSRSRNLAISFAFAGAAALAGCGGASALNGVQPGVASLQSTSGAPAAAVAAAPQSGGRPGTQTVARPGGAPPNPYPTTPGATYQDNYELSTSSKPGKTVVSKGTVTLTIGAATTFNGYPAVDYHSVLNYTKTNGATGTTTTDTYRNFVGDYYYKYGDDESGSETLAGVTTTSSSTQTYGSPFILDILPEKNGNKATEPGAYTMSSSISSTGSGGTSSSTSYSRNNDGSSSENKSIERNGNTYSYSVTINADFSASQTNTQPGQKTTGTTTFSAPSGGVVTVTYTPPGGQAQVTSVPVWWGSTPLLSDVFEEIASKEPVPPRCKSTYDGQSSANLREFISNVDPVAGTTDSEVIDRFVVAGTGVVCITATRTVTTYANRSTGSLVSTTTYGEAQGLQTYTP